MILGCSQHPLLQWQEVWLDEHQGGERSSGHGGTVGGERDTVELQEVQLAAHGSSCHSLEEVERPPVLFVLKVFELGGPVGGKDDHVFAVGADSGRDVHGVAGGSGCVDPFVGEIWRGRDYVQVQMDFVGFLFVED